MKVKKFEAPTVQEAIENVKRELGPEAIILKTKKNNRGFGLLSKSSVEITAAVSDRSEKKKNLVESRLAAPDVESMNSLPATRQAELMDRYAGKYLDRAAKMTRDKVEFSGKKAPVSPPRMPESRVPTNEPIAADHGAYTPPRRTNVTNSIDSMKVAKELVELKAKFSELRAETRIAIDRISSEAPKRDGSLNIQYSDAFESLLIAGLSRSYAYALIKKVAFNLGENCDQIDPIMDQIAVELMEGMDTLSIFEGLTSREQSKRMVPTVVALVGPTGVGKTTTIVKLAGIAKLNKGFKVGLIGSSEGEMGESAIKKYADRINVPSRTVSNEDELKVALEELKHLDLIFIDTIGRSQRDESLMRREANLLESVDGVRVHLLLSSTTRDRELMDMGARYSSLFKPESVIVTKIDEALSLGCIYNISQKLKLPFSYFTNGQKIPGDLEEASKERVISSILGL